MRVRQVILAVLFLAGCGGGKSAVDQELGARAQTDKPSRIVSLDYCSDQYVLKLADRDRILAVSRDAGKHFSYMREAAKGVPTVKATAEDVLALKPDLVVRSYGGGPNAAAFFERAGVPVLNVGWASNVDSAEMGSIPFVIQQMAAGLGEPERGATLVKEFRRRLDAVRAKNNEGAALYMTPSGTTTGPGSLVHEMVLAAGYENFEKADGWRSLSLERLAYEQPELVAAATFYAQTFRPDAWSTSRHPIARKQFVEQETVWLEGAWTVCGAWFAIDAIEKLAQGGEEAAE